MHTTVIVVIAVGLGALVWLDVNREGFRAWLKPQPVLSVVTLLIGFIVLSWQVRRQHENVLAANRRQSQDKLKLDIYQEIAKRIEAASVPIIEATLTPAGVAFEMTLRMQKSIPSRHTSLSLSALSVNAVSAVTGLLIMAVLETYEIVMPEFAGFRSKLADTGQQLREALGKFISLALPFVMVRADGTPLRWPPTEGEIADMSRLADTVRDAGYNLTAVKHDLSIEAQNYLLGGLFGRQLPKRKPTGPSMEVTSIKGV